MEGIKVNNAPKTQMRERKRETGCNPIRNRKREVERRFGGFNIDGR